MEKEETKNKANKTRLALALATYLHTVHRNNNVNVRGCTTSRRLTTTRRRFFLLIIIF